MPPQSTREFAERLEAAIQERALVAKGEISAHQDLLDKSVLSFKHVQALLDAAKEQLAEKHPRDIVIFMFSYVEELERIIALITDQKREGEKYDG